MGCLLTRSRAPVARALLAAALGLGAALSLVTPRVSGAGPVPLTAARDDGRVEAAVERIRGLAPAWSAGASSAYASRASRRVPEVPFLENFDRVEASLYRGHFPDMRSRRSPDEPDGLKLLRALGVTDVVSLRTRESALARERERCAEEGLRLHSIPLRGWDPGIPAPRLGIAGERREVARAVALVKCLLAQGRVVYVHCSHGRDRTGVVLALYRLAAGSPPEAVWSDARDHGLSPWQFGMRRFVRQHVSPERLEEFRRLVAEEHGRVCAGSEVRRT
jgi:protein-tyrosine phosphatase